MKKKYSIAGMHCRSCELLVEQHVSSIPGVHAVQVDQARGTATVTFAHGAGINDRAVADAVRSAGYRLGTSAPRTWLSHDPADWQDALASVAILLVLFMLWRVFGIGALGERLTGATGPGTALVVGLIAGISTCMALIGGLVVGLSARYAQTHPSSAARQRMVPHIAFNTGRVAGFALLGGVIGVAGSALKLSGSLLGFLVIAAGFAMVVLGMKLSGLFPRVQNMTLPSGIARFMGINQDTGAYSNLKTGVMGALTFFLPCGFTQAMQLYAISTGSFVQGAFVMSAFAIGTVPGLLGAGGLSSLSKGAVGQMVIKTAGIGVLLLGLWNVSNGWTLTGIVIGTNSPAAIGAPAANGRTATAVLRDGKQYVDMQQDSYGYSLDRVIVRRGIPVVWTINSKNSYTCASSLIVRAFNIAVILQPGANTVEFTPNQTGTMRFSCSMGMYGGIIEVIE